MWLKGRTEAKQEKRAVARDERFKKISTMQEIPNDFSMVFLDGAGGLTLAKLGFIQKADPEQTNDLAVIVTQIPKASKVHASPLL